MNFNIVTDKKISSKSIYLSLFVTFDNQHKFVYFYIIIHISLSFKDYLYPTGFIISDGSIKVCTWLVYIKSILDFKALSYFFESISDIGSI
jgi:hypothetical protein